MQIVVAHYEEDLSWLSKIPSHWDVVVYMKSPNLLGTSIYGKILERTRSIFFLPNFGRESQTFLYHIVENYDNLDDLTFFCQGWPFDHVNFFFDLVAQKNIHDMEQVVMNNTCKNGLQRSDIGFIGCGNVWRRDMRKSFMKRFDGILIPKCEELWSDYFKDCPRIFRTGHGGQYIATKKFLRRIPKKVYVDLLDRHEEACMPWVLEVVLAEMLLEFYNKRTHML